MKNETVYTKMNKIGTHDNKIKSSLFYLFLEIYLEEKRWIHANPTLYSEGKYKDVYKRYYIADNEQMERFYNTLVNKNSFFVILRGKRGSGKTSFLNYFLNLKTHMLNNHEPLPLTWVRIDTTKLYKTIISRKDKVGFWEYLYTQILFVYLRYKGEKDEKENKVCRTQIHYQSGINFPVESCDKIFANFDLKSEIEKDPIDNKILIEQYDDVASKIETTPHFNNDTEGKCFDCQELGKFLYEKLRKQLIVIVDGIDNINYNSNLKHRVWSDMIHFLEEIQKEKTLRPHKLVIALRNENHELLKEKIPAFSKTGAAQGINIPTHIIVAPKLSKIMSKFKNNLLDNEENDIEFYTQKKYQDFLKEFLSHYQNTFKKKIEEIRNNKNVDDTFYREILRFISLDINSLDKESLEKWIHKDIYLFDSNLTHYFKYDGYEFIKSLKKALRYLMEEDKKLNTLSRWFEQSEISNFFIYTDYFLNAYKKVFEDSTGKKIENTILESLFNGDYREQFIQAYKSYIYLMDYAKDDHEKTRYSSLEKYIESKEFQITRSLFSNGNKYQTDMSDIRFYPPYRNINTINLLNILDKNRQSISPLVSVYLLVYLSKQETSLSNIQYKFDYEEITQTYIEQILQEYLEFGYIQASYDDDEQKLYYKATDKGKHLINFSFNDINAIQTYIYGGLHPSRYTGYYRVYTNKNFASQILFNMLLFWHETEEQEKLLLSLKNSLNISFDLFSNSVVDTYKKLLGGSFPEHYIYSDIEKYITDDKELQKSLKGIHRKIMFGKQYFDELYQSEHIRTQLLELLDQDERIYYIVIYMIDEAITQEVIEHKILRDIYFHEFIFENIDRDNMSERNTLILDALNRKDYWSVRNGLIRKLDFIKNRFGV